MTPGPRADKHFPQRLLRQRASLSKYFLITLAKLSYLSFLLFVIIIYFDSQLIVSSNFIKKLYFKTKMFYEQTRLNSVYL